MKDAVIAKLANQAADFYGDAFKQCQYKDSLPKVCEGRARVKINLQRLACASKQHINNTRAAIYIFMAVIITYGVRVMDVWMVCALSVCFFSFVCIFWKIRLEERVSRCRTAQIFTRSPSHRFTSSCFHLGFLWLPLKLTGFHQGWFLI